MSATGVRTLIFSDKRMETRGKRFITEALKRVAKANRLTKSSNKRMDRTDLLIKMSTARCIKKDWPLGTRTS